MEAKTVLVVAKTVLVVDDEEDVRDMLCKMLKRSGYETQSACNGIEAMEQVRQNAIDLVITDILMPEKEGIETIIELQKEHPEVKIIAISGGGRGKAAHYLDTAKMYGAHRLFSKPFERVAMMTAVGQLLELDSQDSTSSS